MDYIKKAVSRPLSLRFCLKTLLIAICPALVWYPYQRYGQISIMKDTTVGQMKNSRSEGFPYAIYELHRERLSRVQNVCKAINTYYTIKLPARNWTSFFDERKKLFFCFIPKAGSNFWRQTCMDDTGKPYWKYPNEERESILKQYLKVTSVRHPYDRLWSAYTDKYVRPGFKYVENGKKIIQRYRQGADPLSLRCGHNVTFAEFVQFYIDQLESDELLDVHFLPYYNLCNVCGINFDIIVKLESAKTDLAYLSTKTNITPVLNETVNSKWMFESICRFHGKFDQDDNFCSTPEIIMEKNWRTWKTGGVVDPSAQMPALPSDVLNNLFSVKIWESFCQGVIDEQLASAGGLEKYLKVMKTRRKSLKLNAFNNLPKETKAKLEKILAFDMDMFGYKNYME